MTIADTLGDRALAGTAASLSGLEATALKLMKDRRGFEDAAIRAAKELRISVDASALHLSESMRNLRLHSDYMSAQMEEVYKSFSRIAPDLGRLQTTLDATTRQIARAFQDAQWYRTTFSELDGWRSATAHLAKIAIPEGVLAELSNAIAGREHLFTRYQEQFQAMASNLAAVTASMKFDHSISELVSRIQIDQRAIADMSRLHDALKNLDWSAIQAEAAEFNMEADVEIENAAEDAENVVPNGPHSKLDLSSHLSDDEVDRCIYDLLNTFVGEEALGDLTERFQRIAARHGVAPAQRWFRREAVSLLWAFLVLFITTALERMKTRT